MDRGTEEVLVGETQRFECQVVGYPTPTVTWFKDDTNITSDPRYQIQFNRDRGTITLLLNNVEPGDEGCYQCKAENVEGVATTTAYLIVRVERDGRGRAEFTSMTIEKVSEEETSRIQMSRTGKQTVIEEVIQRVEETEKEVIEEKKIPPRISYDNILRDALQLRVGSTLYIEVNVTGFPQPGVTWFQAGKILEESAAVSIETDEDYSYLKVKNITQDESGSYRVLAENAAGTDSAEFQVVVKSPPTAPRDLRIIEVYKDYIIIAWDEPAFCGGDRILGYKIEKSVPGGSFITAGRSDAHTTEYKVAKLFEGNEYLFRVYAENKIGTSPPAQTVEPVRAKLPFDPPGLPKDLRIKEVYKDYITIQWDKPDFDGGAAVTQYVIEKRDKTRTSGMWVVAGTVDATELTFCATKLFHGNWYQFQVAAENRVGVGPAAEMMEVIQAKLPYDKPKPPKNLKAAETNRDYIVISWEAPEDDGGTAITGYVIEKRDARRAEYIYIADVEATTFKFKATRLFAGSKYFFRVIAENQVGTSEPCETEKPITAKLPFDEPEAPRNLRIIEYWTDYITVTWEEPEHDGGAPITGYIIEKRDAGRPMFIKAGNVAEDTFTFKVPNLFEGQSYFFRVFAENKVGVSKGIETINPQMCKMPFDPPQAPMNLKVDDFNLDYITISWEKPGHDGGSPITNYVIDKQTTHGAMWNPTGQVGGNIFQQRVGDLFEGEAYFLRVAAENAVGRGPYVEMTEPQIAKLPYDKPGPPKNLRVTDIWSDYMMLTWEPPEKDGGSRITGYTIEQRDSFDVSFKFVGQVDNVTNSFQTTNLQEGHEYSYRVFAQNAAGLSDPPAKIEPAVRAQLPFDKPQPPRNLQFLGTGPGTISFQWAAPENDGGSPVTAYLIEVCYVMDTKYTKVAEVEGSVLTYELRKLRHDGDYFIRIFAINQAGRSKGYIENESPVCAKAPMQKPKAPSSLRAKDVTRDAITISWHAPEFNVNSVPTGYIIEMRTTEEKEYKVLGNVKAKTLSYKASGLIEGTGYLFRVRSENPVGVSDGSAELEEAVVAKLPFAVPSAPKDLRVKGVTPYSVDLAWAAPDSDGGSPITGYVIEARSTDEASFRPMKRVNAETLSFNVKGLTEGKEYLFRVKAINEAGESKTGAELDQAVLTKAPTALPASARRLTAEEITSSTITLSWKAPDPKKLEGGSFGAVNEYIVEVKEPGETTFKELVRVDKETLTFKAEGLVVGLEYDYQVRSANDAGVSKRASSLDRPVTPKAGKAAPSAPKDLKVLEVTHDSITVEWEAPESDGGSIIKNYVIVMKETTLKSFKKCGEVDFPTRQLKITRNVEEEIEYIIRVYAENAVGVSEEAAELATPVKTLAKPKPKVEEPEEEPKAEEPKVEEPKEEPKVEPTEEPKVDKPEEEPKKEPKKEPVPVEEDVIAIDEAPAAAHKPPAVEEDVIEPDEAPKAEKAPGDLNLAADEKKEAVVVEKPKDDTDSAAKPVEEAKPVIEEIVEQEETPKKKKVPTATLR